MDILEAMRIRRSVRTYNGEPVPQDLLDQVLECFEKSDRLNDLKLRLVLRHASEVEYAMTGLIGSYGKMKDPPMYVVGVSEHGEHYQENFGFAMEQFILECTRLGLGTCWIGGFFKKSLMEVAVPIKTRERIVAVSPVGFRKRRSLADRSMRALGGLNTRKPLSERVFAGRWKRPVLEFLADRHDLEEVFELARWAPSASNRQPCHYVVDEKRIVLAVLTSLQGKYPSWMTQDRAENLDFQGVDAGIAMAHVHLAARELGIAGKWTLDLDEAVIRKQYAFPDDARLVALFDFS